MNFLFKAIVTFIALALIVGCNLPDLSTCGSSTSASSSASSNCSPQNLTVQLVDNHGLPIVSDDPRVWSPNFWITSTNNDGQFTIPNVTPGTIISGYIQDITVPAGESRFYVTALTSPPGQSPQRLNSFGSINDPSFGFNTTVNNNVVTIVYPQVVHYECAYPANYSGPTFLFQGPMISAENVAQDFVLSSNENICKVGIQASLNGFNGPGPKGSFQVHIRLRSDANGIPGTIIADQVTGGSTVGAGPIAAVLGVDSSGLESSFTSNYADYCANSGAPVTLTGGQRYWIEMALVGVTTSDNPLFEIVGDANCFIPTGGLPMKTSMDGANWSSLTLSDPGAQGSGTSQRTPIFLSE
jgi:hypothetical protein